MTLSLFRPGAENSRLSLTYLSYGTLTRSTTQLSTSLDSKFFVYGVRTSPANMPTTGSATFTGLADGLGSIGGTAYRFFGSLGTLTANFATGGLTTSLTLVGNPDVFSNVPGTTSLGTLTGTGTIGVGVNQYNGNISGIGMDGRFIGSFFGPRASETGYAFSATGGGNTAAGVFVGKQ